METAQEEVREVRIEGYPDYGIDTMGNVWSYKKGGRKKLSFDRKYNGYLRASLSMDSKMKKFQAHRLVAFAFIPNPENKPFVNHKNGNPGDNRVENLEWCTHSENIIHAFKYLGRKRNDPMKNWVGKHWAARSIIQYDKKGILIAEYETVGDAIKATNGAKHISSVASGKRKYSGGFVWKYKENENV